MNITQSPAVGLFNAIACVALLALIAWSELHPTHPEFHALPEIRQNDDYGKAWKAVQKPMPKRCKRGHCAPYTQAQADILAIYAYGG